MAKCIKLTGMLRYLLDDEKSVRQGAEIVQALLEAQSPRMSDISEKMAGSRSRSYKALQRFIRRQDLKSALLRLYQEQAEYVIGDPTEMERWHAPKTKYVGTLSDGKTAGYWLMVLSTPFRGRALPFWFIVYSSRTIEEQATSRNQEHFRCFDEVKRLLGERPLVLDREFSYKDLLERMQREQIRYVIRLNTGEVHKQTRLTTREGKLISLKIQHGEVVTYPNVYYLGQLKVNVIGFWRKGLAKPWWIVTNLDPQRALEIYMQRMKIEETFRDCKSLLHISKLMNKQLPHLEQMIALTLITYVIGLWLGEAIRDVVYAQVPLDQLSDGLWNCSALDLKTHPKWLLYSGLFVLLKQRLRLPEPRMQPIVSAATLAFARLVHGSVPSLV